MRELIYTDTEHQMNNLPNDILSCLLARVLCRDVMFVCRQWCDLIERSVDTPLYISEIQARSDVLSLPTCSWPALAIRQQAILPRQVRACRHRAAVLKAKFTIGWVDIMAYCRQHNDVNWLLDASVWKSNVLVNVYEALFTGFIQFREHVICKYPGLIVGLTKGDNDSSYLSNSQHNLLVHEVFPDYNITCPIGDLIDDLTFIMQQNSVMRPLGIGMQHPGAGVRMGQMEIETMPGYIGWGFDPNWMGL
jgi:hypothetical protein